MLAAVPLANIARWFLLRSKKDPKSVRATAFKKSPQESFSHGCGQGVGKGSAWLWACSSQDELDHSVTLILGSNLSGSLSGHCSLSRARECNYSMQAESNTVWRGSGSPSP